MLRHVTHFLVSLAGEVVGTSDLEFVDHGMGVAHGAFRAAPAYSAVRAKLVRAAEALYDREEENVEFPPLQVSTRSGEVLETGFVVIADFDENGVDPEITVRLLNREQFLRVITAA